MSEGKNHQLGNTEENNDQRTKIDEKYDGFWENFSFFISPTNFLTRHPASFYFIFFIVPYIISALTFSAKNGGTPNNWVQIILVAFAEINIVFISVALAVWAYFRWETKIPLIFQWLIDKHRIQSKIGSTKENYLEYLEAYHNDLRSKKKHGLAALFCSLIVLLTINFEDFTTVVSDFHTLSVLLTFLLWSYLIGLITWHIYVTIKYIRLLSHQFDIIIKFGHPDKCGGLEPLGDFCFIMARPVLILGLMAATLGIAALLESNTATISSLYTRVGLGDIAEFRNSIGEGAIVLLFVVILPLLAIIFFVPIWNIHCLMLANRQKAEDIVAELSSQLEQEIREHITLNGELSRAKEAEYKLKIVRSITSGEQRYPVWPFRTDVVFKLFAPQLLISVVGLALSIYDAIAG